MAPQQVSDVFAGIMKKVGDFPISRHNVIGTQQEDRQIAVLVADWTSAEEKDKFEPGQLSKKYDRSIDYELIHPGEQYQSVKPAFGKLVHATNPDFAW